MTFQDPEAAMISVLRTGLDFNGFSIHLTPAIIDSAMLISAIFLSKSIMTSFPPFSLNMAATLIILRPHARNGNRLVKILLAQEIPCFVRV